MSQYSPIVQLQRTLKGQLSLFWFAQFNEAVTHAQADVSWATGVLAEGLFVKSQGTAEVLFVEGDTGFAQERRDVFGSLRGEKGEK